jgi:hypothetical protein
MMNIYVVCLFIIKFCAGMLDETNDEGIAKGNLRIGAKKWLGYT